MKKGEEYTAVVDYVNFPNKGIVKLEGEKEEEEEEDDEEEIDDEEGEGDNAGKT